MFARPGMSTRSTSYFARREPSDDYTSRTLHTAESSGVTDSWPEKQDFRRSQWTSEPSDIVGESMKILGQSQTRPNLNPRKGPSKAAGPADSGWDLLDTELTRFDENKIKDYKEDIDLLLVFSGLFSAVLTSFNVISYQSLQQDPTAVQTCLLSHIADQLAQSSPVSGASNSVPPSQSCNPPFRASLFAIFINLLWFGSLMISLISSSLAMWVKLWLREYLVLSLEESNSPQSRCRVRASRYRALQRWYVFEIAAILPPMVQISLGSFLIGLVLFLWNLNFAIGLVIMCLLVFWATLTFASFLAAILIPNCPYKMPMTKGVRRFSRWALRKMKWEHWWFSWLWESRAHHDASMDTHALVEGYSAIMDDTYLEQILHPCLVDASGEEVLECVRRVVKRRDSRQIEKLRLTPRSPRSPPITPDPSKKLQVAGERGLEVMINVLLDAMERDVALWPRDGSDAEKSQSPSEVSRWMYGALSFALSRGLDLHGTPIPVRIAKFLSEILALGNEGTTKLILNIHEVRRFMEIDATRDLLELKPSAVNNIINWAEQLSSNRNWQQKPTLLDSTYLALSLACRIPQGSWTSVNQLLDLLGTKLEQQTAPRFSDGIWYEGDKENAAACLKLCEQLGQDQEDNRLPEVLRRIVAHPSRNERSVNRMV